MDAVNYLTQQHRNAEKLFSEFRTATASYREELVGTIRKDLEAHMEVEEKVFYPAMKDRAGSEIEHAVEEHGRVRSILQQFQAKDVDSGALSQAFESLEDLMQDHIGDEEAPGGIMEQARQHFNEDELAELTERMEEIQTGGGPAREDVA